VAEGAQPGYFADARDGGQRFRVYTAAMPDTPGGALVRASRASDADDGALRDAALLLAGLTVAAAGITYGLARLSAGRILRPIADLTAAAEHVSRTRDLTAAIGPTGTDEVGRLGMSFDTMLRARRGITRRFLAHRHPCDLRRLASMSKINLRVIGRRLLSGFPEVLSVTIGEPW
jgi:two-component system, OmpR family, sensor histidine kinase MprB